MAGTSAKQAGGKKAKPAKARSAAKAVGAKAPAGANPLLETWTTPFAIAPFDKIKIGHFMPALDKGFAVNRREIAAIAGAAAAPSFANTIEALERAGKLLDRAANVFFNLAATDTNPEIQALERALAPRFAKHGMRVYQNEELFARVDALYKKGKRLKLSEEQQRVLKRYHRSFVMSGAGSTPRPRSA